jgi:probable rRNA maturation factor
MSDSEDPGGAGDHPPSIIVTDEQTSVAVDARELVALASHALRALRIDGAELSIVLAEPDRMQALKSEWMGIDEPTDVLAFPMDASEPAAGPRLLGDVVLCPAVATAQAPAEGRSFADEMNLLLVHGILHLIGHDHADEDGKAAMWAEQDRILASYAKTGAPA